MDSDKKYLGGWWIWIAILLIGTMIVMWGLRAVGLIGHTIIERKVFEESFQYSEARKTEIATFSAQLVEIERLLQDRTISDSVRHGLEGQAAALRIQLSVARSK